MTRGWTAALGLAVAMLAGVLAPGTASAGDPYIGVDVEVTVWRALDDGELYVGARDTGGLWRRHPAALDLSVASASGRFHRSEAVALTVPLAGFGEVVVEAVVWRSVADPSRLHLSVRREGKGERWRTVNEPLAMRTYEPYEWQRYERADAVTVEFAFFDPLPRASVTGPLAVFAVESGDAWTDAEGWGRARDVYALDTATDRYWRVLEYWSTWPEGVLTAGEHLIVWDGQRVRRVWLEGWSQTVLYEGENIREVAVSPDGAKVAVMAGDGALTVLDAATGDTLLRVGARNGLTALLPETGERTFTLGGWSTASDGIALVASMETLTRDGRTGIFMLDGAFRALPPNTGYLSPDMRHAVRPRGGPIPGLNISYTTFWGDHWVWSGFDVIEVESGRVVHSVTASDDTFILPHGPSVQPDWQWPGWWPGADRFSWFEMGRRYRGVCGYDLRERQPPAEGAVTASTTCGLPHWIASRDAAAWEAGRAWKNSTVAGPRIFDIATGEARELAQPEWRRALTDATRLIARGGCWGNEDGQACSLFLDGRPVWNGAVDAVGVIELDEPLRYGPLTLHIASRPRPATRASAPAREEMVGPLYAWTEANGYETEADSAGTRLFHEQHRIAIHDAGTGRSWHVHDYRFRHREQVWRARGGFVVWSGDALRYVTLAGEARTLLVDDRVMNVRASPGGGQVIVSLGPESSRESDVTLALFALPSGEELLRFESTEPRFEKILEGFNDPDVYWIFYVVPHAIVPLGWNADQTAFSIACGDCDGPSGVFGLDGAFTALPPDALHRGSSGRAVDRGFNSAGRDDALSPDFRYVAAGKGEPAEFPRTWDAIDIVEVASGQIVRTVPVRELSGDAVGLSGWGWRDGRFAWSPGNGYDFEHGRIAEGGGDGVVWLIDLETGATERLTAREYAARRSPSAVPTADYPDFDVRCPGDADPIQLCAVLLDGEVVGEGRWAEAIGFVALD